MINSGNLMAEQMTGAYPAASSKREQVLFEMLDKFTGFYEDTIGILSGIFKLSEYVNQGSPERDFYTYVVDVLISESRCSNASLFMIDGEHLVLTAAAGSGTGNANRGLRINLGEGVAGKCAADGESVLVEDVSACEFFKKRSDTKVSLGSMLCVPVKEGGQTIGVLNLSHEQSFFFTTHDIRMFELFGLLVGQMLTLANIYDVFRKEYTSMEQLVQDREQRLECITARYRAVVDASEEMILLLEDERTTFVNQRLLQLLGNSPAGLEDIFPDDVCAQIAIRLSSLEKGQEDTWDMPVAMGPHPRIIGQFSCKRLDKSQVMIVVRDITLKKRMEQRSMQTEKLTSLGLLTSGIAHELNNKLTPILGFTDLIDTARLSEQDRKRFALIGTSADSAKKIVESLLTFSRNLPPEKTVFDLREVIDRAITLYKPTIAKRGISISHEQSDKPLMVFADMSRIEQVLVNLINNAIDAIAEGQGHILIHTFAADGRVHVHVDDSGPGIPEESMSRIFDPFFTTKPEDKGTGLGLSICFGIMRDHDGVITLENTGTGTSARIQLPFVCAVREANPAPHPTAGAAECHPAGDQAPPIMVVEDEDDLRELMIDALSPRFAVHCFRNGREALDHVDDCPWAIILSDLRMPVMNGMDLYHAVAAEKPELCQRFLFITGDTYDTQVKDFLETTGVLFLRKPFHIRDMLGTVAERIQSIEQGQ